MTKLAIREFRLAAGPGGDSLHLEIVLSAVFGHGRRSGLADARLSRGRERDLAPAI